MIFEWDEHKNRVNRAKHHVSFETAQLVFFDPFQLTLYDRAQGGEERWHTIGKAAGVQLLLVVHTHRDEQGEEIIRIISARRPTRKERERYEQG